MEMDHCGVKCSQWSISIKHFFTVMFTMIKNSCLITCFSVSYFKSRTGVNNYGNTSFTVVIQLQGKCHTATPEHFSICLIMFSNVTALKYITNTLHEWSALEQIYNTTFQTSYNSEKILQLQKRKKNACVSSYSH